MKRLQKDEPWNRDLSFEEVCAAYDAVMAEGRKQHVIVWGAMVSVGDAREFIRAAFRAVADRRSHIHEEIQARK
jgi:hypothetical protein